MNDNLPLVILFDGVCNLCNSTVQFIIKRDKQQKFKLASIQGKFGQQKLIELGIPESNPNSFVLLEGEEMYMHSTGALRVFLHLGGYWKILYGFIIIPRFIRDGVYSLIARNRYKWFGKDQTCYMPSADISHRFFN